MPHAHRVLEEYLSCPEEIVGVEHLLSAQRTVRESLKVYHARALMFIEGSVSSETRWMQSVFAGCEDEELLVHIGSHGSRASVVH